MFGAVTLSLLFALTWTTLLTPRKSEGNLKNFGVKERSKAGEVVSKVADKVLSESGYDLVRPLVPYVKECEQEFGVPANVLLAILYEEAVHRKPVDLRTFGVAQLGVGELVAQGLPPDSSLLTNDRLSVWLLAKKLKRLQGVTGSLRAAITLHNGYTDYLGSVQRRARDPRLLSLLTQSSISPTYVT